MSLIRAFRREFHLDQKTVAIGWLTALLAPHWFLAQYAGPAGKLGTLAFAATGLVVALRFTPSVLHWPQIAWVLQTWLTIPLAINRGYQLGYAKYFLTHALISMGAMAVFRRQREVIWFASLVLLWQALWYLAFGLIPGRVAWHPDAGNADGFGPLMAILAGTAYFYGAGSTSPRTRYVAWVVALLCVGGVVSSFARGAVLALACVVAFGWLIAPRKGRNALAILGALTAVLVAGLLLDNAKRGGNDDSPTGFFADFATVKDGTNDGTGQHRLHLWSAAWRVFVERPITGAGFDGTGTRAAQIYREGELTGDFENPRKFDGLALHNVFVQILSDTGLVGSLCFLWILVDFGRRNLRLRRLDLRDAWRAADPTMPDLLALANGTAAGMIGYAASGFFYNQLFAPWIVMLITVNALLDRAAREALAAGAGRP